MINEQSPSREHDQATIARLERLAARGAARAAANDSAAVAPAAKTGPRRRSHPSKKSRAAALGLSLATTAGLSYAFATTAGAPAAAPATTATTAPLTTVVSTTATATRATATPAATTPAATSTAAPTATGTTTVNGAVLTNKYGTVQVQAIFTAGGSLSAVNVVQLPTDRKSVGINDRAVPVLNREAISIQGAKVHTVSGATYTSKDYVLSLQAAIDTARAAGITQLL
jgi:uncharacterized protein with FMN-binding domain